MNIIEIKAKSNGAHANQTISLPLPEIPKGWAIIPENMDIPAAYPFVNIEVSDGVVTSMTAGKVPEPTTASEPPPTAQERLEAQVAYTAMMTDTLLEEG